MWFNATRKGFQKLPLGHMLERSAALFGRRIALRKRLGRDWNEYSYDRLLSSVKSVARFLKESGCKKEDHLAVFGDNSPEWVVAYMACLWIGAVVIPLDGRAKETEITSIIEHGNVTRVFVDLKHLRLMEEVREKSDSAFRPAIVSLEDHRLYPCISGIQRQYPEDGDGGDVSLGDLAMIVYTSGTTGDPKGVMLTHGNIVSNIDSICRSVCLREEDRFFSVLPASHIYECTVGNCLPLCAGASISYARSLKPREMLEDVRETEPTVMLAVPLLLEKILAGIKKNIKNGPLPLRCLFPLIKVAAAGGNALREGTGSSICFRGLRERMGFGKLRFFVSGGAALPPGVQIGLEEFGFKVLQGYGLTETAPVLTMTRENATRPGCVGQALPDITVEILNKNAEGFGEVAAKGPNVMRGYYRNENETRRVFTEEGYFLTGDVGRLDDGRFLYLSGRSKSVIVTKGGLNIFPEEVEGAMLQSPFIQEIVVTGGINARTGDEEVHAIVYPNKENVLRHFLKQGVTDPATGDVMTLMLYSVEECSKKLAPYKRIRNITLRDKEFPKTAINKIKRHLLQHGERSGIGVTRTDQPFAPEGIDGFSGPGNF
jgi:long-chain acyl-CoA synthetase